MTVRDILIGVDVGGTFTDAVVIADGRSYRAKSPSTYPEIGRGVLAACKLAAEAAGHRLDELLPRVKKFGLGTTAVTNVIATRTGLRTGLVTTKGFEETLRLARGRTQEEGGWLKSVDALVEAKAIVGVDERIDRNGVVLKALDPAQVVAAARYLADEAKVEAIAVSFLWSFLNQSHEREAARLIRETLPGMPVTAGVELRPVIREYERTTLAVLNAYAKGAYRGVDDLANELRAAGLEAPVLLCHSGGGAISIEQAREQPVWLSASGPAAGVAAAARIARDAGEERVLTCDLGGTSFDVAHLEDGAPARTQRGDLMGFWTALPRVDVESVGAGGGSLTWIDERGMLRVGPRSAGSNPGPVCYGRGGTQVALTDALVVLGYIDPAHFLGGAMALDKVAAVAACEKLGEGLGLDAIEAAWGVREIAVAEMVKAVRARLSNHALAASEHCLVSYGGCGALFAAEVAKMAGLTRVLIPELASVLSAYGAATMDIRRERLSTLLLKLPGDAGGDRPHLCRTARGGVGRSRRRRRARGRPRSALRGGHALVPPALGTDRADPRRTGAGRWRRASGSAVPRRIFAQVRRGFGDDFGNCRAGRHPRGGHRAHGRNRPPRNGEGDHAEGSGGGVEYSGQYPSVSAARCHFSVPGRF